MFGVGAGFQNCQLQGGIARNNTVLNGKEGSCPHTMVPDDPLFQDHIVSPGISVSALGWSLSEISTQILSSPRQPGPQESISGTCRAFT